VTCQRLLICTEKMRINKVAGSHFFVYSAVTMVAFPMRAFIARRLVGGVCWAAMFLFIPPLPCMRTTTSGSVRSRWRHVFSGWLPIPTKDKTLTRQNNENVSVTVLNSCVTKPCDTDTALFWIRWWVLDRDVITWYHCHLCATRYK